MIIINRERWEREYSSALSGTALHLYNRPTGYPTDSQIMSYAKQLCKIAAAIANADVELYQEVQQEIELDKLRSKSNESR